MRAAEIVDLDRDESAARGRDRRAALVVAFAMCLGVASAFLGTDSPSAIKPPAQPELALQAAAPSDVALFAFPDRLANEPLPTLDFRVVQIRGRPGLALPPSGAGDATVIAWTEGGSWYWLSSPRRQISELVDIADKLHRPPADIAR